MILKLAGIALIKSAIKKKSASGVENDGNEETGSGNFSPRRCGKDNTI